MWMSMDAQCRQCMARAAPSAKMNFTSKIKTANFCPKPMNLNKRLRCCALNCREIASKPPRIREVGHKAWCFLTHQNNCRTLVTICRRTMPRANHRMCRSSGHHLLRRKYRIIRRRPVQAILGIRRRRRCAARSWQLIRRYLRRSCLLTTSR